MKLNPDVTREILFIVEKETDTTTYIDSSDFKDLIDKYGNDVVSYHAKQAGDSHLIEGFKLFNFGNAFSISDLTPKGHEFLANIRTEENWKKTKSIASKVGSTSLSVLTSIAEGVSTAAINKLLNQ